MKSLLLVLLSACATPIPAAVCAEEYSGTWFLQLGDDCERAIVAVPLENGGEGCSAAWTAGCGFASDCPAIELDLEFVDDQTLEGTGTLSGCSVVRATR